MTLHAPFAEFEALVNREAVAHLSNAVATLAGVEVCGIFDDPYLRGDVGAFGMADSRPTFSLLTGSIPPRVRSWLEAYLSGGAMSDDPSPVDMRLQVRGIAYRIAEHRPDGAGMSVLHLTQEVSA